MKRLIQLLAVLLSAAALEMSAADKIVVGYYPAWYHGSYPHTAIQYASVTHIAHAFIFPNANGSLDLSGYSTYPEMIQAAHQAGVKVVISVGGWDTGRTPRFSQLAADPAARTQFARELKQFCLTNGYDGADIDWEYPGSADRPNVSLLFTELRDTFATVAPRLTLSIAAPASDWNGGYDWTVMAQVLDWIGVMTYDFYGSWSSTSGPNSALYAGTSPNTQGWVDNSVTYYTGSKGVPAAKLLIGIPFYGWEFNASTMYGTSTGAVQKIYSTIAPYLEQGWTRSWDQDGRVPYMINPGVSKVISYDDTVSVREKCQYVVSRGVAGAIVWAIGQDYIGGEQPLLSTVQAILRPVTGVDGGPSITLPQAHSLDQNYPNPFNAGTVIRYRIGAAGHVLLAVYSMLGETVEVLVDREMEPGAFETRFLPRGLASGPYIYRLTAPGVSESRIMLVIQ